MTEEHYGWEVFAGAYAGATATLALLAAGVGALSAWALSADLWIGVIAGAVAGGVVGLLLGHVPASQRTRSKRREMTATLARLAGAPLAVIALTGAGIGLLRALL